MPLEISIKSLWENEGSIRSVANALMSVLERELAGRPIEQDVCGLTPPWSTLRVELDPGSARRDLVYSFAVPRTRYEKPNSHYLAGPISIFEVNLLSIEVSVA